MKIKKYLAFIVMLVMVLSIFSACSGQGKQQTGNEQSQEPKSQESSNLTSSGFPIVKEPITLKMFGQKAPMHGPWEDMLVFKEYEKMTNIKVEFETPPQDGFQEKKNLVFASNELPDAFIRAGITNDEVVKYGMSGALIPLETLIEKYAPNVKKLLDTYPDARKSIIYPDGHIYTLPTIVTLAAARTDKIWLNKNWLDKAGKSVPVTLDDLVDVLRFFRDNDMNGNGKKDEIPMMANGLGQLINNLSGSWGLENQMGYHVNIENGKVNIWLTDDRFKEMLMFLNKLYKEKLIDQELFSITYAKFLAKANSGVVGLFFNQADDVFDSKDYIGIAPFKGPNGDQKVGRAGPIARDMGAFAITSTNKYPEATMRWIDYFYSDEGSIFFRYGVEGQTYVKKPDGSVEYTDAILKDSRGIGTAVAQFTIWPGGGAPHWINDKNSTAISSPTTREAQKALDPYMPKEVYGPPLFDKESMDKAVTLQADIDKYFNESCTKFIDGDIGFDKWDEYVNTMNKLGLKELEALYQKAFDSMNAK